MITCQRNAFNLSTNVTYLNCSYMSPQLKVVEQIGLQMVKKKNDPTHVLLDDFFTPVEKLKEVFAELINCSEPNRIATIPSVSYGLANVANNLKLQSGDNIVLAAEQFPSNYYSWAGSVERAGAIMHIIAPPKTNLSRTQAWNEAILNAIDEHTKMVTLGTIHWADGTLFDLVAIRKRTREVGALLVLDGTQSVGALPFNVQEVEPDALICGGYKWLMGPYSLGVAYYGPAFDQGVPIEENWINRLQSEDFRNLVNYQPNYKPGASRYAVGEQSNFILVPMLSSAIQQLLDWSVEGIQEYCKKLTSVGVEQLKELGCQIELEGERCGHLFGVRLGEQIDMEELSQIFKREKVYVSVRGNSIRISPHLYNDSSDMDHLVQCFRAAKKRVLI